MSSAPEGLWVFAYGSLMWHPGFPHLEARPALLHGYHRALCVLSIRYRGTQDQPGLVLGLDRGGSCRGRAFRVAQDHAEATKTYLEERELVTGVYAAKRLGVRLDDGRRVAALAFVAKPEHPQYVGTLPPEQAAAMVLRGHGANGSALDYLRNVVQHLDAFGIVDGPLHRVLEVAKRGNDKARAAIANG